MRSVMTMTHMFYKSMPQMVGLAPIWATHPCMKLFPLVLILVKVLMQQEWCLRTVTSHPTISNR